MSKIRTYTRNLIANWTAYGVNMALTVVPSGFVFLVLADIRRGPVCRADRGGEFRGLTVWNGFWNER